MAEDIGISYRVDFTECLAGFDKIGQANAAFNAAAAQSGQAASGALSAAAKSAVDYSDRLAGATAEQRNAAAAARDAMRVVQELTQANRELGATSKAANSGDEYRRLQGLIAQNTAKIREANAAILENKAATDQERAAVEAVREARRQETNQTKLAAAAAKEAAAATKQGGAESGGFFSGLLGKISAAGAGLFAFSAIYSRVQQGLQDFAAISGVQATFRAVAGGAAAGAQAFAFVKQQSAELGLELVPTAKAYAQLFTAAKEANLPVAETERLFKGVTSAAKVLNLSQAETEQALTAVQQMLSKGTVSSEELRRQLGNALPGAFGLAAKAAGLTTTEFGKQLAAGKILANDFLPKFSRQLQATYGEGTAEAATNVRANLGRINTFFSEQSALIGDFFAPSVAAFARFVGASTNAAKTAESTATAYFTQADAVRKLSADLPTLLGRYDSLSTATDINKAKQAELRTVIDQIAGAVPGAVTAFDKYGKALGINGAAVAAYLKNNRALSEELRQVAVREGQEELKRLLAQQKQLENGLNGGELVNGQRRFRAAPTVRIEGVEARQVVTPGALLSQAESDKRLKADAAQAATVAAAIAAQRASLADLRRGRRDAADEAGKDLKSVQGLIEKQEKLIAELKAKQKEDTTTETKQPGGAAFLLGLGGLDAQLADAEKELARLLGRVEKGRRTRQLSYEAQLRALLAERETLKSLAAKAAISTADDATGQAKKAFEEQLRQVEVIRGKLEQRERDLAKQARRVGGRRAVAGLGEKADGRADGVEAEQLTQLQLAAAEAYNEALFKIEVARRERLFELREDTDQKELDAVARKYAALLETNVAGGAALLDELDRIAGIINAKARVQGEEEIAIEEAKQLALLAARKAIADRESARKTASDTADATIAGATFGPGTTKSLIEAKRDEKRALLDIERQSATDALNNALLLGEAEGKLARKQAQARLAIVAESIQALEQEKAKARPEDMFFGAIFGKKDTPQARAQFEADAATVINTINQILSAQLAAEQQKISQREQNITDLQSQLSAEIQLNKDGAASNIAGIRKQIDEEKAAKREALAESRRIAKQQQLVSDLQAVSSISLAVANIIAGWSTVPVVGSLLGLAAAGATVAAFIATKASASDAARTKDSFFVGGFTGEGDPRQESRRLGERSYQYENREFVMRHQLTDQYRHELFEPLHQNRPQDINWRAPQMQALLPDYALPGQLQTERAAAQVHLHQHSFAPMREELAGLREELRDIKATNAQMAGTPATVALPDGRLVRDYPNGSMDVVRLD